MKNSNNLFIIIIILLHFSHFEAKAQKITRGPDTGEIYFLGLTNTGKGLYYSIDFGESAICVDNSVSITTIAADMTNGCIYMVESPSNLYFSSNYGYSNSWVFRNGEGSDLIKSGVSDGFVYSGCVMHSEDFGVTFSFHAINGFFGSFTALEIDNQIGTGHILLIHMKYIVV